MGFGVRAVATSEHWGWARPDVRGQKQEEAQKEQKKRRPTREVIAPWVLGTVPFLLHGLLRVVVLGVPRILQSLLAVNSLQLHF